MSSPPLIGTNSPKIPLPSSATPTSKPTQAKDPKTLPLSVTTQIGLNTGASGPVPPKTWTTSIILPPPIVDPTEGETSSSSSSAAPPTYQSPQARGGGRRGATVPRSGQTYGEASSSSSSISFTDRPAQARGGSATDRAETPRLDAQSVATMIGYKTATVEKKRAYFCYLLQYQHYNAEFTKDELQRLGYPTPLCAPQDDSSYVRSNLSYLTSMWTEMHKGDVFFRSIQSIKSPFPFFDPLPKSMLEAVFDTQFCETQGQVNTQINASKPLIIPINLTGPDLAINALDIVKTRLGEKDICLNEVQEALPCFLLFQFRTPGINCVLAFAARCYYDSSQDKLVLQSVGIHEVFKCADDKPGFEKVYSLLTQIGAVPDRLALHECVARGLTNDFGKLPKDLKDIRIATLPAKRASAKTVSADSLSLWTSFIAGFQGPAFPNHPEIELYRKAIIEWHHRFFEHYQLSNFAAPLLLSEVATWMTPDPSIVKWAKAYQNLCEIVMFYLQSFPEKFDTVDLKTATLNKLDPDNLLADAHRDVGLFPYATSAFFYAFNNVLDRFIGGTPPTVVCLSQNYFETAETVKTMQHQSTFDLSQVHSLNDIKKIPNILIAEIHPNNAANQYQFQNDVANWIEKNLPNDNKMVLILDITINHVSDKEITDLLVKLYPFILNNRLEIFGIQSLAKMVQLGADNFSGGLCLHLGGQPAQVEKNLSDIPVPAHKAAFFALLTAHFHQSIDSYFQLVRQNVNKVNTSIADLSFGEWHALKVAVNTDAGAVYVTIRFERLSQAMSLSRNEEEKLVGKLLGSLLDLAKHRKLPLTKRQSFGFTLSSMSQVCDAIRFSIGIEGQEQVGGYCDLLKDFNDQLSLIMHDRTWHDINKLTERVKIAYSVGVPVEKNFLLLAHAESMSDKSSGATINFKLATRPECSIDWDRVTYEMNAIYATLEGLGDTPVSIELMDDVMRTSFLEKCIHFKIIVEQRSVSSIYIRFDDQREHIDYAGKLGEIRTKEQRIAYLESLDFSNLPIDTGQSFPYASPLPYLFNACANWHSTRPHISELLMRRFSSGFDIANTCHALYWAHKINNQNLLDELCTLVTPWQLNQKNKQDLQAYAASVGLVSIGEILERLGT